VYSASNDQLTNNTATKNGNTGVTVLESSQETLTSNVANNNDGYGFTFTGASSNTVTGNNAIHNGGFGFYTWSFSQYNLFTQNRACQSFYVDAFDDDTGAGNNYVNNSFCTTEGI